MGVRAVEPIPKFLLEFADLMRSERPCFEVLQPPRSCLCADEPHHVLGEVRGDHVHPSLRECDRLDPGAASDLDDAIAGAERREERRLHPAAQPPSQPVRRLDVVVRRRDRIVPVRDMAIVLRARIEGGEGCAHGLTPGDDGITSYTSTRWPPRSYSCPVAS